MRRYTRRHWYKPAEEKVNRLLDEFQEGLDRVEKRFHGFVQKEAGRKGMHISCREGCTHCCRYAFICTFPEGMLSARHMLVWWHEAIVSAVEGRLEWCREKQEEKGSTGWFAMKEQCAFLNKGTGQCTIYSVRPGNCRFHLAVSEPALCENGESAAIANAQKASELRSRMSEEFMKVLTSEPHLIMATLPRAVLIGLQALRAGRYILECKSKEESKQIYEEKWKPSHDMPSVKQEDISTE